VGFVAVEIEPKKSFRYNLEAGVSKEILMKHYCIDSEEKWNKLIASLAPTKKQDEAKEFRRKMIMGKELEEKP
jgi:hypothetical protein